MIFIGYFPILVSFDDRYFWKTVPLYGRGRLYQSFFSVHFPHSPTRSYWSDLRNRRRVHFNSVSSEKRSTDRQIQCYVDIISPSYKKDLISLFGFFITDVLFNVHTMYSLAGCAYRMIRGCLCYQVDVSDAGFSYEKEDALSCGMCECNSSKLIGNEPSE